MDFVFFSDILDMCQAEAIASKLDPNEASIYRFYCRQYSKLFSTPLAIVKRMDITEVVKEVMESRMDEENEDENLERYLDIIYRIEDPEYEASRQQDSDDFMAAAVEAEAERVRLGKPIHPALKGESTLIPDPVPKSVLPKSGGVNLSYLEKEEQ